MGTAARIPVKPALLEWACERAGHDTDAFAASFPRLSAWLANEESPTLKQLEKFANATHTPLGYLFLPDPPEEPLPIRDFRVGHKGRKPSPSPNLLDTIYTMQRRQEWLRETLVEDGADPLDFVGSAKLSDDPSSKALEMRRRVGIANGWAGIVSNWQEAVSELRRRIEQLGIMAVIKGLVGNSTNRALEVSEFRGFAMSDPYAPLIFVNGADAKSAQMFTLAHELAHVWLGSGGLSGFDGLFPKGTDVELWCNEVAAEFLVPAQELKASWKEAQFQGAPFEFIARHFKISPIVAARRALDLKLIGKDAFFSFYNEYTSREVNADRRPGGSFYNNQNTRVGEFFATRVLRAALEGRVGFKEAYDLTGLRGGTFQEYAARLGVML